jgi:hypothetical protein
MLLCFLFFLVPCLLIFSDWGDMKIAIVRKLSNAALMHARSSLLGKQLCSMVTARAWAFSWVLKECTRDDSFKEGGVKHTNEKRRGGEWPSSGIVEGHVFILST